MAKTGGTLSKGTPAPARPPGGGPTSAPAPKRAPAPTPAPQRTVSRSGGGGGGSLTSYGTGGSVGTGGMDPGFAAALNAFIEASGGRISITSGYRSPERQAQLFAAAVQRYGSEQAARRWVAPPGRSNHNRGIAADLRFTNAAAREWAHQNAAAFGLHFPMGWEPWHIEPISARGSSSRDAYTTPPDGRNFVNPRDALDQGVNAQGEAEDPYNPGIQAMRLFSIIGGSGEMVSEAAGGAEGATSSGNALETISQAASVIAPTVLPKQPTGAQKGV